MNVSLRRVSCIGLLTIVVAVSIVGCAQIRELTYPKGFTYLEEKEVDALMQKMRGNIVRLDQLVAEASISDASKSDTVQQQKIIAELTALERIATRLSGDHTQTNHFVISDHIEQFITDIGKAKMFANMSPPRYYHAGKVAGSCMACHQFR